MFAPLLLAAAFTSLTGAAGVPPALDAQLVLEIRATAIYPDVKSFARAGDSNPDSLATYIYIGPTGCEIGASSNEPTRPVSAGWHVTGRVLQRTGDSVLARLEWQRVWEQSQRVSGGSKKTMDVWIQAGDSLPLDEIASVPTPPCRAQGARLEATVTEQVIGPPGARMSGTVGAGATGRGTGGGTGAGAGAGPTFGPGIASILPVDLDVWLVHTRADGTEDTQHQRVSDGQGAFSFPAISIATAQGIATVRIEGGVRAVVDVSGERQLRVSVRREVTGAGASKGQSLSAYQLPGPDDVYAIELPALRVNGGAVKAVRLSIRVRLAK